MAYGQNLPFGLQPEYNVGASSYQTLNQYAISPTYTSYIFTGDPVMFLTGALAGTIGTWTPGNSCLGVFQGVKYIPTSVPPSIQGVFQYSPYWGGATSVMNGSTPQALVLDDPSMLYNIQASWPSQVSTNVAVVPLGIQSNQIGLNAQMNWGNGTVFTNGTAGGTVPPANPNNGSPTTGQLITGLSVGFLDLSTVSASATNLLKIIRLTNIPVTVANVSVPQPPAVGESGYISQGNVFYTGNSVTPGFGVGPGAFNNVVVAINNDVFKGGTGTATGGTVTTTTFTLSAAEINGMYAAPITVLQAPAAGLTNVIISASIQTVTAATAPFAGGGSIGLQYGTTVNLGGTLASGTVAAASFIAAATAAAGASNSISFSGVPVNSGLAGITASVISLSNATAAFTTGTTWTGLLTITYATIPS